jgi:hypothetical protein
MRLYGDHGVFTPYETSSPNLDKIVSLVKITSEADRSGIWRIVNSTLLSMIPAPQTTVTR